MREYYFLASFLPQLEIGHVPALGFVELKELLKTNVSSEDFEQTRQLLRIIDFENLRAYWANQPFDPRGNVSAEEMEQALIDVQWPVGEEFAGYLRDYLRKYHNNEERLEHFPILLGEFFHHQIAEQRGFLKGYFSFMREMHMVLVGFRAKNLGKDVALELQYEDATDPIVAQILAQRDSKTYEPPFEYKELKPIFEEFSEAPLDLHKALYAYQFAHIREICGTEIFTIERILNYMARLILVERWLELDVQKGIEVIDTIEKEIQ